MLGWEKVALLYDVCTKIVWWVGLAGTLTHCVLNWSLDGDDGIYNKYITEWAQVPKRTAHVIGGNAASSVGRACLRGKESASVSEKGLIGDVIKVSSHWEGHERGEHKLVYQIPEHQDELEGGSFSACWVLNPRGSLPCWISWISKHLLTIKHSREIESLVCVLPAIQLAIILPFHWLGLFNKHYLKLYYAPGPLWGTGD